MVTTKLLDPWYVVREGKAYLVTDTVCEDAETGKTGNKMFVREDKSVLHIFDRKELFTWINQAKKVT